MSDLNPNIILSDYKNNKLNASSTMQYLISYLEEETDEILKVETIEIFIKIIAQTDNQLFQLLIQEFGRKYIEQYDIIPQEAIILGIFEYITMSELKEVTFPVRGYVSKGPDVSFKINKSYFIKRPDGHVILADTSQWNNATIKCLGQFNHLEQLAISDLRLTKIFGLDIFSDLKSLTFYSNKLENIQGLDKLINLTSLRIIHNKLKTIENLDNLTKLEFLDLSVNKITEIDGLDNLQNLKKLHLNHNKITELKRLGLLTNLEHLNLEYNEITEVKGLENLKSLVNINLNSNPIPIKTLRLIGSDKEAKPFRNWCIHKKKAENIFDKPKKIYTEYLEKKRNKENTIKDFISIFHDYEFIKFKVEVIKFLNKIGVDSEGIFKIIEKILKSEKNAVLKEAATTLLINHYFDRGNKLIKWLLDNEKSVDCLVTLYLTLGSKGSDQSRELMRIMEEKVGEKFIKNNGLIPREALGMSMLEKIINMNFIDERKDPYPHHTDVSFNANKNNHVNMLDIKECKCQRINFLNLFPHLRRLRIAVTDLFEINGLESLSNLVYLDLHANNLHEVPGLEYLENLQEFYIDLNPINHLKGIEKLKNLMLLETNETNIPEDKDKKYHNLIMKNKECFIKEKQDLIQQGNIYWTQGDINKAIESYEQAKERSSKINRISTRGSFTNEEWHNLAKLYYEKKVYEKALDACEQGIKVDSRPKEIRELRKKVIEIMRE